MKIKRKIPCEQKKYNNNTHEMIMWVNSYVSFIDSSLTLRFTYNFHALTHLHTHSEMSELTK